MGEAGVWTIDPALSEAWCFGKYCLLMLLLWSCWIPKCMFHGKMVSYLYLELGLSSIYIPFIECQKELLLYIQQMWHYKDALLSDHTLPDACVTIWQSYLSSCSNVGVLLVAASKLEPEKYTTVCMAHANSSHDILNWRARNYQKNVTVTSRRK